MIYCDYMIYQWALSGGVTPFDPACINPASIDLRWSGRYRIATPAGWGRVIEADELTLRRSDFFLLDTLEVVSMPNNLCGTLALKSSMGRNGFEHLHAGWVDPKFSGSLTWEVENRAPWELTIKREQRIMQLVLAECYKPNRDYSQTGRYNGQSEPEAAR